MSDDDNESFRGESTKNRRRERKIPTRRATPRRVAPRAGPRLRNGSRFSALDLNVVYVTGVKPPHAFARDIARRSRRAVADSSFLAYIPHTLFPADFIYRTNDSNDEGINRPCLASRARGKERK